jgi:hypothetical protein
MSDERYWAADDVAKFAAVAVEKIDAYYDHVQAIGLLDLWRASNRATFAGFYTGGELGRVGKAGEFTTVEVNDYGNLHHHLFTTITGQRPNFEARATVADHTSQEQAPIAVAVSETAMREKKLEPVWLKMVDTMLRAGEAVGLKRWDTTAGPTYTSEPVIGPDGMPVLDEEGVPRMREVHAGDVEFAGLHPIDAPRDVTRAADEQEVWFTRLWRNRWHLAAQYPELREKILTQPSKLEETAKRPLLTDLINWGRAKASDDVAVYYAFVDRSPAVPDGRMVTFLSADCILDDQALPHRQMPIYRMAAKELEGTAFGYSLLWDVLAPQMAVNNLLSTVTSAAKTLGMPTVWQPESKGLVSYKVGGINVLKGGTTKPEVLNLLDLPTELFQLVELYLSSMERISGVNAVFRGQAADGQKGLSGAAYALFAARAVEFASRFQGASNKWLEDIITGTVYDYQDLGRGEYIVTMAGEGNAYRVQSFLAGRAEEGTPDVPGGPPRIDKISRITLRLANPMQATTAGKMSLLETLVQIPGAITTPAQALQVLSSGRLDPATKATERELENIAKENERLGKGEPVQALITDKHWLHIPEHASVGASPEAREQQGVMESVTVHVEEHAALMRQVDPVVLAMQGCPPEILQMLAATMTPPPLPGETDGTALSEGGATDGTMPAPPEAGAGPGMPNMPQMPNDPRTGERVAPPQMA